MFFPAAFEMDDYEVIAAMVNRRNMPVIDFMGV
jgi:hypothetical protein